jgi:phospholipid transport system substrate-binding protein
MGAIGENGMNTTARIGTLLALCWTLAQPALAVTAAHEIVRSTTDAVMAVVRKAPDYIDDNPDRYYQSLQDILDPVIDFRGFARNVMGPYATSERYRSLDEAGKARLRDQLDRFTEVMRSGLVRTYGKGLIAFGGSRIELAETPENDPDDSRAAVRQLIYNEQATPYEVIYQMGRSRDGAWQLRNMIIENVNLGEIYQSQFEAAARRENGDLDAVIDNWSTDTPDVGDQS